MQNGTLTIRIEDGEIAYSSFVQDIEPDIEQVKRGRAANENLLAFFPIGTPWYLNGNIGFLVPGPQADANYLYIPELYGNQVMSFTMSAKEILGKYNSPNGLSCWTNADGVTAKELVTEMKAAV